MSNGVQLKSISVALSDFFLTGVCLDELFHAAYISGSEFERLEIESGFNRIANLDLDRSAGAGPALGLLQILIQISTVKFPRRSTTCRYAAACFSHCVRIQIL